MDNVAFDDQPPPYTPRAEKQPLKTSEEKVKIEKHSQTIIHDPASSVPGLTNLRLNGPNPTTVYCGTCERTVRTKVRKEIDGLSYSCLGLLCLIGCWECVFDAVIREWASHHHCSNCGAYQGTYESKSKWSRLQTSC